MLCFLKSRNFISTVKENATVEENFLKLKETYGQNLRKFFWKILIGQNVKLVSKIHHQCFSSNYRLKYQFSIHSNFD
jgi:hypothetical protein